jgi:glycine cleavage system aminomethyltransferase T
VLELGPPIARTPLHHWHAAHGARFVERDGWQVVAAYSQAEREAEAAGAGLGLADLTAVSLGRPGGVEDRAVFWLLGPRLGELLRRLTTLHLDSDSLPGNSSTETALAGVEARLVFPVAPSLPSVQIHVGWDVAEYVWERIFDSGRDLKMVPLGLDTLQLLVDLPAKPI